MEMNGSRLRIMAVLGTLAIILSGCAETEFLIHTAKRVSRSEEPAVVGGYKVGKPYQIENVWYYPEEN